MNLIRFFEIQISQLRVGEILGAQVFVSTGLWQNFGVSVYPNKNSKIHIYNSQLVLTGVNQRSSVTIQIVIDITVSIIYI